MNEMIERVAAAMGHELPLTESEERTAREVIATMREPTNRMAMVAFAIESERYAKHCPQEDGCAIDCWRAMIDEALK